MRPLLACLAALPVLLAPVAAHAEFLNPTFETLAIDGIAPPDWIAGVREGAYIGMCGSCEGGMVMLEIKVHNDDGTGGRVRSGETTTETYTELGKANAQSLGGESEYFGTKEIESGPAVGFKTNAKIATGDYSTTYQLWSDGKQLVIRVYGADQTVVDNVAEKAYSAAAPQTFR
ncbi:hypothetical protein ASG47_15795 [Devosia sp. Leaf420]|uniref:hypothetical protein n=1 Tax=Devosia sp. Leaf420 TaxID=1736374 RepID=UPI000713862D|nr:hypothetical protein [Devosia sp. Leaf420]KQT44887.1 hypothetical protein ASG47_15795 [Devosia sp. Leaf420]